MHRCFRLLVHLLIAAQLLLALPAMAAARVPAASGSESHCGEMRMPVSAMDGQDCCPCCPEDADSLTDCLVSCTLHATMSAPIDLAAPVLRAAPPAVESPRHTPSPFEPPLDPPPIG